MKYRIFSIVALLFSLIYIITIYTETTEIMVHVDRLRSIQTEINSGAEDVTERLDRIEGVTQAISANSTVVSVLVVIGTGLGILGFKGPKKNSMGQPNL
ncbi:MAG: hypothetical protein JST46_04315 [Bacteroidetes bacterium]|nr:hypothetical protein [Bacteroidota bacterium]